ncbi:hypothetical protein BDW60DRAFT_170958 [Aspergillus nidulans var. acristatus]|jgi:hypothetical protein
MHFSIGTSLLVLVSILLGLAPALPTAGSGKDDLPTGDNDMISRDFAIIGGGASGTFAAVRLREQGKSVVLIERDDHLGGHTHTYYDSNGTPIDYGVWIYSDNPVSRSFFEHFNIPVITQILNGNPEATRRLDFRTGQPVAPPTGNVVEAMTRYAQVLLQYPYLMDGWDLPYPVPEDLLLSFRDFIEKHDLQAAVETLALYMQGFGEVLQLPAVYVMKLFHLGVVQGVQTGFLRPASQANSDLYRAAEGELGDDLLLSSTVAHIQRSAEDSGPQHIVVRTPKGHQRVQADKVIVTIPPLLGELENFDLDERESGIFGRFENNSYFPAVLRISGLPGNGTQFLNKAPETPYNIAPVPSTYVFDPTANRDLWTAFFGGGSAPISSKQARQIILDNALSLRAAGYPISDPEIVAFRPHVPFALYVSSEDIADGFYRDLYGLQGYRNTFYTGAAFHAHDSGELWRFTENLLNERVLVD